MFDHHSVAEWTPPHLESTPEWYVDESASWLGRTARSLAQLLRGYQLEAVFAGQTLLPWAYKLHIRSSLGEYQWSMDSSTRYLAVIKPDAVEIRSAEDEFGSRLRGWPIPNDPWPMWRQAAWSHDCEVLAIASSEGHVAIRSAHDGKLHHLVVKNSAASVFISPVAYMTLRKPRAGKFNGHTYAYEIVVVLVDGMLYCYLFNLVRENTTNDKAVTHVLGSTGNDGGFRLHHKRAVCGHLSCVTAAKLNAQGNVLVVGGFQRPQAGPQTHLVVWHIATAGDRTVYRRAGGAAAHSPTEDDETATPKPPTLLSIASLRSTLMGSSASETGRESVVCVDIAPSSQRAVSCDVAGKVTLWQCGTGLVLSAAAAPADMAQEGGGRAEAQDEDKYFAAQFWSDDVVILTMQRGGVRIVDVGTMTAVPQPQSLNLHGFPSVLAVNQPKAWLLERQSRAGFVRWRRAGVRRPITFSSDINDSTGNGSHNDDEEERSEFEKVLEKVMWPLIFATEYLLGDIQANPMNRKIAPVIKRTYSLRAYESLTPSVMVDRKIKKKQYDIALAVAKGNGLSTDSTYLAQWEDHPDDVASLSLFLDQVQNRLEVVLRSVRYIPPSPEAMRALLEYGLAATDALLPAARRRAGAKDQLSPEDLLVVNYRMQLLNYLDRLDTFEQIVEVSPSKAVLLGGFAANFDIFRNVDLVKLAIDFAEMESRDVSAENVAAVGMLLTRHRDDLEPFRLHILARFPETVAPRLYAHLLPTTTSSATAATHQQQQQAKLRASNDWCTPLADPFGIEPAVRQQLPPLDTLSTDVLRGWYKDRALQLDEASGLLHHSAQLLEFACSGVGGLVAELSPMLEEVKLLIAMAYKAPSLGKKP